MRHANFILWSYLKLFSSRLHDFGKDGYNFYDIELTIFLNFLYFCGFWKGILDKIKSLQCMLGNNKQVGNNFQMSSIQFIVLLVQKYLHFTSPPPLEESSSYCILSSCHEVASFDSWNWGRIGIHTYGTLNSIVSSKLCTRNVNGIKQTIKHTLSCYS